MAFSPDSPLIYKDAILSCSMQQNLSSYSYKEFKNGVVKCLQTKFPNMRIPSSFEDENMDLMGFTMKCYFEQVVKGVEYDSSSSEYQSEEDREYYVALGDHRLNRNEVHSLNSFIAQENVRGIVLKNIEMCEESFSELIGTLSLKASVQFISLNGVKGNLDKIHSLFRSNRKRISLAGMRLEEKVLCRCLKNITASIEEVSFQGSNFGTFDIDRCFKSASSRPIIEKLDISRGDLKDEVEFARKLSKFFDIRRVKVGTEYVCLSREEEQDIQTEEEQDMQTEEEQDMQIVLTPELTDAAFSLLNLTGEDVNELMNFSL